MIEREAVLAADRRHLWHPYTEMGSWIASGDPIVAVRAEGARFWDADGRSFLDGNASWWVAALGHGHPRLVAALREQAERMCHVALAGVTHAEAALLAEELCAVAPAGLSRVFFSDDGSTAVEVAVKMCAQLAHQNGRPRRTRVVALEHAFHGETVGSASLGGVEVFRRPYAGLLFDCIRVPSPADDAAHGRAFEAMEEAIARGADEIACVVVEPLVQGAAGMQVYAPAYLSRLRAACDAHEVPLVFDEVFTGYGRTGAMWAADHAGVAPDLLCTAKGFSGGMLPMAATLASERIFAGFLGDRSRAFFHGHSYCGNPLGAAVAREVLRVYRDERVVERTRAKSARIAAAFAALAELPGVSRPRGLGMIGAVDLDERLGWGERELDEGRGWLASAGWRVYEAALRRGAYLRPLGNVVYVTPPLNIEDAELDLLLRIVTDSVAEVATRSG